MSQPAPTVCGSISLHPVIAGARMHQAGYEALGLNFSYVPFRVEADVAGALAGMRALHIRGFGVSMPFKLQVIPLLDEVDPLARAIGAVNTIVNDDGRLIGHNTDAHGAVAALRERLPDLNGARIAVIGAGGAARAVCVGLLERRAELSIYNRTESAAVALADELGRKAAKPIRGRGLDALGDARDVDVLVNASSAGMADYGPTSPVPDSLLEQGRIVMDIVYAPMRTELIERAEAAGCVAIPGARMLLHQATRQFTLYTGRPAPMEAMDRALTRLLESTV